MSKRQIMLGNDAFARGAWEAGVKVSSAYPGTPSTEISESIALYDEVYAEWAPNEKVALEVAAGASYSGVRSLAVMKHVGLNVAADPLYSASYTGVNGGLVIIVADDPGIYSSQNNQDTRAVARAAKVPVIEPSDSNEAKEFIKFAYELSEKYDTPVIVRSTARLSHSQDVVELMERVEPEDKAYQKQVTKYVLTPANATKRHVEVLNRNIRLQEDGCDFPINKVEYNDLSIGVITSGIPYQYVKEALPEASVLKLGLVNPLPKKLIEEFASKVDKLYIFEELDPIIEEQVRSWGIDAIGKEIFGVPGEYSVNLIKTALLGEELDIAKAHNVPARPPVLCPGCPHRSTYHVMNKLKLHGAGDIGCYTLGAAPPQSVLDTTLCMGSSISTYHGMVKAKGKEFTKDWVAVIGDSTFMHTGINSLTNMVYNQSSGIVLILDNSTTAMTGHQDNPATGTTLKGDHTYQIDFVAICKAIGVPNVQTVDAFDLEGLTKAFKEAQSKDELTVIISKAPCALLDKRITKQYKVNKDACKKCGACLKPGCPAITRLEDGKVFINDTLCNGCGLCFDLCKVGAIELVDL